MRKKFVASILAVAIAASASGCAEMGINKEQAGTIIGGLAGAAIGATMGKGNGKIAATLIASGIGGYIGNRIGNSEFTLNGISYRLAKNDGANHLHGGRGQAP